MSLSDPARSTRDWLDPVEGLRGVAVLWVMLFHYVVLREGRFADPFVEALAAWRFANVVAHNGFIAVDLFFLITGFLLTIAWLRGAPPRDYFRRRIRRIVPAFYVQLAVLFFVVLPLLRGYGYFLRDLEVLGFNLVAHLAFLHNLTPLSSASLGINGALWTLSVEAQWYLLLPLLAPLFVRSPALFTAAAIAIALYWRHQSFHGFDAIVAAELRLGSVWGWTEESMRQQLVTHLPAYLAHFAAGMLAARAWVRDGPIAPGRAANLRLALALAALAILYWVLAYGGLVAGGLTWLYIPAALGLVLHAAATCDTRLVRTLLCNAPLRFAGRVSYSAYLYHLPLLVLWNTYPPPLPPWANAPAYALAALAIAWLSWRFVELPFYQPRQTAKPEPWPRNVAPGA